MGNRLCSGPRAYLLPLVICTIDLGMRRGELVKLRWSDVDMSNRVITVQALNTKTRREMFVVMRERVARELEWLHDQDRAGENALVFGVKGSIKKAFNTARRNAGLQDLYFRNLRHTAASRRASSNIPIAEIAQVLGRSQISTSFRYINANLDSLKRAADAIDTFNVSRFEDDTHRRQHYRRPRWPGNNPPHCHSGRTLGAQK